MESNNLLAINTCYSVNKYFEEELQNDNKKIYEFLIHHTDIPSRVFMERCVNGIILNDEFSNKYKTLLFKYVQICRKNGVRKGISLIDSIKLGGFYKDNQEYQYKEVMENCTSYIYSLVINKSYAQLIPSEKDLKLIDYILELKLSTKRIVYIYMNTKLRIKLNLDCLISILVDHGYKLNEILNCLKEYWILGQIKYVQATGLVRVATGSISISRLIAFYSDKVPIMEEQKKVVPEVGMLIRFKIQDYLGEGRFKICNLYLNSACGTE